MNFWDDDEDEEKPEKKKKGMKEERSYTLKELRDLGVIGPKRKRKKKD